VSARGADRARIEDYALSLLLHDIGKFWERSSEAPSPTPQELQHFCPRHPETGSYVHLHAALSARFVSEVAGLPALSGWGPRHHLPDPASREELCGQLADWLAAGESAPDESRDAPAASSTPLRAPAPALLAGAPAGAGGPAGEGRPFALGRLDGWEESLFPPLVAPVSREDYRFHWNHFTSAVDRLAPEGDLETWSALLEVFGSRIPAAATNRRLKEIPDVDLFSHSRAVAALGAALYLSGLAQGELQALRSEFHAPRPSRLELPLVSLLAGKVVGRRRFLLSLPEGGAARSLRGRALFLDLLLEAAARRCLRRLGLPWTSLLWIGSDHFALLGPAGARLEAGRDEVEPVLERETRGELGLEAAALDLTLGDFRGGLAGAAARLEKLLAEAEAGRLARLAQADFERIFGSSDGNAEEPECPACGAPAPGAGARSCLCASLEELGARAGEARFLVRRTGPASPEGWPRLLADLGWPVDLEPHAGKEGLRVEDIEAVYSLGRLELDPLSRLRAARPLTCGFRLLAAGCGEAEIGLEGKPSGLLLARLEAEKEERAALLSGGAGLPRLIALSARARHLLAGWGVLGIARSGGRLACLGADAGGLLVSGEPGLVVGFAEALARGFSSSSSPVFSLRLGAGAGGAGEPLKTLLERAERALEPAADFLALREMAGCVASFAPAGSRSLSWLLARAPEMIETWKLLAAAPRRLEEPGEALEEVERLKDWLGALGGRNIERLPVVLAWAGMLSKGKA
jgi:hypothetical protein